MDARLALVVLSIGTKLKALFASTRKPAGQIPFGNPTGTGLGSSEGFAYDPVKNELKMSAPSNGNYTGMVSFGSYGGFGSVFGSADMFFGVSMQPGSTVGMLRRRTSDVVSYVNVRYTQGVSFHTGISTNIGEDFNAGTTNRRALIDLAGNMAVGDHHPTERLDVAGNVKFSGALMPGNDKGAAGMVLHSNGSVSYWAYTDTLKRTFGNWIVDTGSNAYGRGILKFYYYGAFDSYASIEPNTGEGVDVVGLDFNTCYGTALKYTPLRLATGAVIFPYIQGASFLKTSSTGIVSGVTLPANGAIDGKFLTTDANGDIQLFPAPVAKHLDALDGRPFTDDTERFEGDRGLWIDFQNAFPGHATHETIITVAGWVNWSGGPISQLGFGAANDGTPIVYVRQGRAVGTAAGAWGTRYNFWHSGNFDPSTFYTKTEVNALVASTYKAKGSKANYASLPTTDNTEGDVWNLIDTGENYVWVLDLNNTGVAGWDKLSGVVDLTGYAQQSWVTSNFAPANHNHAGVYEPVISAKGSAFNKDFGTSAGTVCEGNDSRLEKAEAAYGWGDHAGKYWEKPFAGTLLSPVVFSFVGPGNYAQKVATGGVLASNDYADISKIPTNGIYSKGNIESAGVVKGTSLEATDILKVLGKTELGASVSTATTPVNTYIKLDDTHHTLLLTDDCDVELPDPATLQNTTFELVRLDEAKSVDFVGYNLNDNRNGTAWVPRAAFRSGERDMRIKAVQDPYSADWCWIVVGSTTY